MDFNGGEILNFSEWVRETSRECPSYVTISLTQEVLINAIKVAMEELMTNKEDASLDIEGICRIYLGRSRMQTPLTNNEEVYYWRMGCVFRRQIKDIINGKRDLKTLTIGSRHVYYEKGEEPKYVQKNRQKYKPKKPKPKYRYDASKYVYKQQDKDFEDYKKPTYVSYLDRPMREHKEKTEDEAKQNNEVTNDVSKEKADETPKVRTRHPVSEESKEKLRRWHRQRSELYQAEKAREKEKLIENGFKNNNLLKEYMNAYGVLQKDLTDYLPISYKSINNYFTLPMSDERYEVYKGIVDEIIKKRGYKTNEDE